MAGAEQQGGRCGWEQQPRAHTCACIADKEVVRVDMLWVRNPQKATPPPAGLCLPLTGDQPLTREPVGPPHSDQHTVQAQGVGELLVCLFHVLKDGSL